MRRMLLAVALLAATPAAAQTELSFSSIAPPNHPLNTRIFQPWAVDIEKATGGKVKIRFLAKPIAHPNQHYDAVIKGQVDIAFGVFGYQPERFLPYLIAELPFLGESAVHSSVALWRIHKSHIEKAGIVKHVELLSLMTHGPGLFHHAKKPIRVPEDLKGQKMRVGGDVSRIIVEHFGGVPITQPAPKSYEILSQGIADGILFPQESVKGFNLTKLVPHSSRVKGGLYNQAFWIAMNKGSFAKLDADSRAAIRKLSGEAFARRAGEGWDLADKEGVADLIAAKGSQVEVSPAMVVELKALTAKIEADYATRIDELGLNGKELIAAFRAEVEKVAAGK